MQSPASRCRVLATQRNSRVASDASAGRSRKASVPGMRVFRGARKTGRIAMAISEQARKNHDELFPGHVPALAVTDPELIEVFDNFAFDEVLQHSSLSTRTRLMVQLAALIGARALSEYRVMLGAALTAGVTPVEAREIIYQAVPYTGMCPAFDFIHATNDVLTERGIPL